MDIPTETKRIGRTDRVRVDELAMCELARTLVALGVAGVCIEHVQAGGNENASTAATLVEAAAVARVAFVAAGVKPSKVAPAKWIGAMRVPMKKKKDGRRDKGPSLEAARALWPDLAADLKRVKDGNRAEALLIAEYFRRSHVA